MSPNADEITIDAHSQSALANAKHNLRYLYDPKTAGDAPARRRTRAVLRILRSSFIFILWRLVRYAKYVAIGSLVATLSAGALGTVVSGAGFVLAPTGIAGTIIAGTVWGVGKFAVKKVHNKWEKGHVRGDISNVSAEKRAEKRLETVPW